jgi:hypothetical protein
MVSNISTQLIVLHFSRTVVTARVDASAGAETKYQVIEFSYSEDASVSMVPVLVESFRVSSDRILLL